MTKSWCESIRSTMERLKEEANAYHLTGQAFATVIKEQDNVWVHIQDSQARQNCQHGVLLSLLQFKYLLFIGADVIQGVKTLGQDDAVSPFLSGSLEQTLRDSNLWNNKKDSSEMDTWSSKLTMGTTTAATTMSSPSAVTTAGQVQPAPKTNTNSFDVQDGYSADDESELTNLSDIDKALRDWLRL